MSKLYLEIFDPKRKRIFEKLLVAKKYHPEFNPRLFLEQLVYYGDINDFSVTFLKESYTVDEIKGFLANETKQYDLTTTL